MQLRIGIDLGGTKIEVVALGEAGQVLARHRVPTPQGDYAATLAAVVGLVERVEDETGRRGTVGVGTPQCSQLNANPLVNLRRPR